MPFTKTMTDEERYISKCAPPNENGCRLWTDQPTRDGYGRMTVQDPEDPRPGGTGVRAHRWGYEHFVGPIPDGLLVCHTCDVPLCQTPEHWFLGTVDDNNRDRMAKGRTVMARGSDRGHARLTDLLVRQIRASYARGGVSQRALAREHGVTQATISSILLGKTWTHV